MQEVLRQLVEDRLAHSWILSDYLSKYKGKRRPGLAEREVEEVIERRFAYSRRMHLTQKEIKDVVCEIKHGIPKMI